MWGDQVFSAPGWTSDKLVRLFNSEPGPAVRGSPEKYRELQVAVASKTIEIDSIHIKCAAAPSPPGKGQPLTSEWKLFRRCKHGGGDLHGWLKWWAYHWVLDEAGSAPELEAWLPGYGRADLHLGSASLIVECGNTSAEHALKFLKCKHANRFVVLPFQRAMLNNMGQRPTSTLMAYVLKSAEFGK